MPVTEILTKGKYFVAGVGLYYIKDMKPDQGLLLVENCYTQNVEWVKASKVRNLAREVIKTT